MNSPVPPDQSDRITPSALAEPDEERIGETPADALTGSLLNSRQRWRDLLTLAADFAFETDAWGRFVLVAPDPALGWPTRTLLGQPAELLLAGTDGVTGTNPFRPTAEMRGRRAWLKRRDGTPVCFSFAAAPLLDGEGHIIGARGAGHDMSEQEGWDAAVATALRRGEVMDDILLKVRKEVLAPRMMEAALLALAAAVGAEGAAVVDLVGDGVAPLVRHQSQELPPSVLRAGLLMLEQAPGEVMTTTGEDGELVLACPGEVGFGEHDGLLLWRAAGGRVWDADDRALARSAIGLVRMILDHEAMQREMARQARSDPLTELLNRRAFFEEIPRRIERLERDELPGTLIFLDLDNFKALNDKQGHDNGDEALCLVANLLRESVRPADLAARLGGDEFALWLDGTDELAAAERADALCQEVPRVLAQFSDGGSPALTASVGLATRWPGDSDDIDLLLQRADQAMYEAKRSDQHHWRVAARQP
jgi:diguanylate cyclase (GGDEF)-like protein